MFFPSAVLYTLKQGILNLYTVWYYYYNTYLLSQKKKSRWFDWFVSIQSRCYFRQLQIDEIFFFGFICFLSNQTGDKCTRFVNFTLFDWIVLVPILGFWKLINFVLFISSIMKQHVDQLKIIYNDLVLCLIPENILWKVFKVK